MSFAVRFTDGAKTDLDRLYTFLVEHDIAAAERALAAVQKALVFLQSFPFSCRKASSDSLFLREMLVPFGTSGYVLLFEIDDDATVTVLALRHQREDDYW